MALWHYLVGIFGGCLEGILEGKPTKNQHQNSQKLSTNFLIETPKRVLPRDSHYFLLGPINPFKSGTAAAATAAAVYSRQAHCGTR